MSRPFTWYPLHHADPVPGDPAAVRAAGHEHERVAAQIATAADELRAIAGGIAVTSQAVDEVAARAGALADTIERAHARYAAAGRALVAYADGLERAQALSLQARDQATAAMAASGTAADDLRYFRVREEESQDEPEVAALMAAQVDQSRAALVRADRQLDDARDLLAHARAVRDDAAETARAIIAAAVRADDLHDTFWQDVRGGVEESGLAVWNGMDEFATGLSIAALALCWVPGVNAAVAAVATVAGAVVLVRDVILLAQGNGSVQDVVFGAAGLVSFGAGRVLGQGLRTATNANRAAQGARAATATTVGSAAHNAASSTGRAAATAAQRVRPSVRPAGGAGLASALSPRAMLRDLASDVRDGAGAVVAATRGPAAAGVHAAGTGALRNPVLEGGNAIKAAWGQNRLAGALRAVGNEDAARDVAYLAQNGGGYKVRVGFTVARHVGDVGLTVSSGIEAVRR
ncbi:hypothetical protein AB6N23_03840 [Cellulomonas sp. 179-A 9B4 NHS]|uniref:hypothetical protein n=1 Tax=Cellulomonas sp. 179-A 9B4 NHS TaxID=3142379 RepID=UPI0039A0F279